MAVECGAAGTTVLACARTDVVVMWDIVVPLAFTAEVAGGVGAAGAGVATGSGDGDGNGNGNGSGSGDSVGTGRAGVTNEVGGGSGTAAEAG